MSRFLGCAEARTYKSRKMKRSYASIAERHKGDKFRSYALERRDGC
ncbi:hypothetical protein GG496_000517 [Candidatus Fervidibacteria bacterium JGI MDM2 JNZ-1-D12]